MTAITKTAKKRVNVTEAEIVDGSRPIEEIMKELTPSVAKPSVDVEGLIGKPHVKPTALRRIEWLDKGRSNRISCYWL